MPDILMQFSTIVRKRGRRIWVLEQFKEILENYGVFPVDDVTGRGVWRGKNSTVYKTRMDFVSGM